MTTLHNNMARIATEAMLHNWKHGLWNNDVISQNIFLSKSPNTFPSPDGSFHDPDNEMLVAIEFKPPGETKRGILTGLGQTLAYLNRYSAVYFVCPEYVEGFKIDTFIEEIFKNNLLNHKIPIGLISYSNGEPNKLKLISEISTSREDIKKKSLPKGSERYWAKYVDATPHLIWTLLDVAFKLNDNDDRRSKIWEIFFDEFYVPKENQNKLEEFESKVYFWDREPMKPLSTTIKQLKKKVESEELTIEEGIKILKTRIDHNFTGDNLYHSYRKNYFPLLDHLGLWDDQAYLTELGYELHKKGKLHGATSNTFRDYLAKIFLVEGKHLDLILDIEKFTRNVNVNSSEEARKIAYANLEEKGLVQKNPNRATSECAGKFFSNELQLWVHLGLLNKNGSYYIKNKGFMFNWEEITRMISL